MAESETGWTKEFPKVDGAYYVRLAGDATDLTLTRVEDNVVHEFGVAINFGERDYEDCEWLGPISPSDVEQLSELRRVGTNTLRILEMHKERHLLPQYLVNAIADLRDALAGIDRTATVQCADCLTWFKKETSHTCAKQVKANCRRAQF